MPHMPTTNKPFDLTTEHGRAQSYAHSPHGAFLVAIVEYCLQEQTDTLCETVETIIDKELEQLNPVGLDDATLSQNLWLFHSELGVRDKNAFAKLARAYEDERSMLAGNIALLTRLLNEIRIQIGIDNEEDTE